MTVKMLFILVLFCLLTRSIQGTSKPNWFKTPDYSRLQNFNFFMNQRKFQDLVPALKFFRMVSLTENDIENQLENINKHFYNLQDVWTIADNFRHLENQLLKPGMALPLSVSPSSKETDTANLHINSRTSTPQPFTNSYVTTAEDISTLPNILTNSPKMEDSLNSSQEDDYNIDVREDLN
ncbi:unnamed protein product, partial [Brenthis ino]